MSKPNLTAGDPPRLPYVVSVCRAGDPRHAKPGEFVRVTIYACNPTHALLLVRGDPANAGAVVFDARLAAELRT
jgi:hypothetical protein